MQRLSSGRAVDGFGWSGESPEEVGGDEIRKVVRCLIMWGPISHDKGD